MVWFLKRNCISYISTTCFLDFCAILYLRGFEKLDTVTKDKKKKKKKVKDGKHREKEDENQKRLVQD